MGTNKKIVWDASVNVFLIAVIVAGFALFMYNVLTGVYTDTTPVIEEVQQDSEEEVIHYTKEDFKYFDVKLFDYGAVMLKYDNSGILASYNNPYAITDSKGNIKKYFTQRDAYNEARQLIKDRIHNYDVNSEDLIYVFSDIFRDTVYCNNIPDTLFIDLV